MELTTVEMLRAYLRTAAAIACTLQFGAVIAIVIFGLPTSAIETSTFRWMAFSALFTGMAGARQITGYVFQEAVARRIVIVEQNRRVTVLSREGMVAWLALLHLKYTRREVSE